MSAAVEKIARQIAQLHEYHLEVKQKVTQKEAELKALLNDLVVAQQRAETTLDPPPAALLAHQNTASTGTSPHAKLTPPAKMRAPVVHACPLPFPSRATTLSLFPVDTAPPQTQRAPLRVPALRIKGDVPNSCIAPADIGPTAFPSSPLTDPGFLLGATDSISLMLTSEQRRFGDPPLRGRGHQLAAATTTRGSVDDSIDVSPIRVVRRSEDGSVLTATLSRIPGDALRLSGAHRPSDGPAPVSRIVTRTVDPTPSVLFAMRIEAQRRVRFSSRSPQVEMFSVERAEPFSHYKAMLPTSNTGSTDPANPVASATTEPLTQPHHDLSLVDAVNNGDVPFRNSLQDMLSAIADIRDSIINSSSSRSSGGRRNSGLATDVDAGSFKTPARVVTSRQEESDTTEAATPTPSKRLSSGAPGNERVGGPRQPSHPIEAASPAMLSISPELVPFQNNTATGTPTPHSPCGRYPELDSLASPIFLKRGRAHASSFEAKRPAQPQRTAFTQASAMQQSIAVNLSSITVNQATSILERYGATTLVATLDRGDPAPNRLGGPAKAAATSSKGPVRLSGAPRTRRRQRGITRIQTVPSDDAAFESQAGSSRTGAAASSAPISLACGPRLYFS